MQIIFDSNPPENFFWMNKPETQIKDNSIILTATEKTDFWQRTRYGFSKDNGHALLTSISSDFKIKVKTNFSYNNQYDQCGILLRIDSLNWIKVSIEKEDTEISRLGSVVTNLGYSDWATSNVNASVSEMWYCVESSKNDFMIHSSTDGENWQQIRIAHLHSRQKPVNVGIYACSPEGNGFTAEYSNLEIDLI